MAGTIWAFVPSMLAIALALITKEVYVSMFAGVLLGALFAVGFHPVSAMNMIVVDGFSGAVSDLAGNLCFLVILGILAALLNKSGGSAAFGRWAKAHIHSRTGVQFVTFLLGVLIFIDDYFNCITVGTVMRPVTDRNRISRAKLAFLIDATAAPVCMIAPVSSWAAAVSGFAGDANSGVTGIQLFIRSIPYNFYSLLTMVFVIMLILMKFDYGPMAAAEANAIQHGVVDGLPEDKPDTGNPKGKTIDLVLPVLILIAAVFFAMLYVGGYFGETPWIGAVNKGHFISAFGDTDAFIALPLGGLAALMFTWVYMILRRTVRLREMTECIPQGFLAMVPSILILVLAASLKTVTSALGAADYVHSVMAGAGPGLYHMLPAVIFVVSVILAFSTGTSWGTFGILIPIVTTIFPADSSLFNIGISACLAGAVCGDHCSPISDTTIMSSAGAQIEHVQHVSTQLPYALTVAGISFLTYIAAGFVQNALICILVGIFLTIGTLWVIRYILKKQNGVNTSRKK